MATTKKHTAKKHWCHHLRRAAEGCNNNCMDESAK